jgi:5-phospho-D-xylono-1,4-lactonase
VSLDAHPITTVLGPRALEGEGLVDAHGHVWVGPVRGGPSDAPRLDDQPAIRAELEAFAAAGGQAVIDCQPPGAGRDASRLTQLARATGVALVACTGFHLPRYYAADRSPWCSDPGALEAQFIDELRKGMKDSEGPRLSPRAGAIKAAHPGGLGADVRRMFEAAVAAAISSGVMLVIHTERGAGVERLAEFLLDLGMSSQDVMLCHVDKRPDISLHRELAQAGFLLEYDTFLRPKYAPAERVWPLVEAMLVHGHEDAIACGLDLADRGLWRFGGDPHGMCGLADVVVPGLRERGASDRQVQYMTGGNVRARLRSSGTRSAAA